MFGIVRNGLVHNLRVHCSNHMRVSRTLLAGSFSLCKFTAGLRTHPRNGRAHSDGDHSTSHQALRHSGSMHSSCAGHHSRSITGDATAVACTSAQQRARWQGVAGAQHPRRHRRGSHCMQQHQQGHQQLWRHAISSLEGAQSCCLCECAPAAAFIQCPFALA